MSEKVHFRPEDLPTWATQENYDMYCHYITEYEGLIPSSFDEWVAFNVAIDNEKDRQVWHVV